MDARRMLVWKLQHIKRESIRLFIVGVISSVYIVQKFLNYAGNAQNGFDIIEFLQDFFKPDILIAAVLIFLCEGLAWLCSHLFQKRFEDSTKLTEDYDKLMKQYKRVNLVEYDHVRFPGEEIAFRGKDSNPFQFEFNHKKKWKSYEVPKQIAQKSAELMKAHDCSKIYNNINVRLENCQQFGNTVRITYSRTMYYDLLVTNRVMDYPLEVEKSHTIKSVRQIYEPGPFLSPLSRSKLSNHLGFNGFVELADGYIIFVQRSGDVSIGKKVWSASVNASYKTEYGLNDKREMSAKYMGRAIRREIQDELKIPIDKNKPLDKCIFAFYRDLVEGGKPHFVFYYRVEEPIWTKEFFEENFRREYKKRKDAQKRRKMTKEERIKDNMIEDGAYFEYFSLNELKNSSIRADRLTTPNEKTFKMQSDGSISLALLLKHLTNVENRTKMLIYDWLKDNIRILSEQMPVAEKVSADDTDRLAKILVKILLGETTVEDAAYSLEDFTLEMLTKWAQKAEKEFKNVFKNSSAWIYP